MENYQGKIGKLSPRDIYFAIKIDIKGLGRGGRDVRNEQYLPPLPEEEMNWYDLDS